VGKRAAEKAILLLEKAAEKEAEESSVPRKTRFPNIQYTQFIQDPEKEGLM